MMDEMLRRGVDTALTALDGSTCTDAEFELVTVMRDNIKERMGMHPSHREMATFVMGMRARETKPKPKTGAISAFD